MDKEKALKDLLCPYLQQALNQYTAFVGQECPTDAKGMSAYQNACKSALSHIAFLIKLMNGQEIEDEPENDLQNWIKKAKENPALQEDTDVEFD